MKKWLVNLCIVGLLLLLGACNKELTKEEVIDELKSQANKVESYHADIDLGVEIIDQSKAQTLESSKASLQTDLNEKKMAGYGVVQERNNGRTTSSEYYFAENQAYLKTDQQGWQMVESQDQFSQDDTFYNNIIGIIVAIEGKMEMQKQEDTYVLTFKGKDLDVYQAFEDPYSVSFTGIEPEEVNHEIKIIIDAETLFIEQLENRLTGEVDHFEVSLDIYHRYENINEYDEIIIPKEVITEASL